MIRSLIRDPGFKIGVALTTSAVAILFWANIATATDLQPSWCDTPQAEPTCPTTTTRAPTTTTTVKRATTTTVAATTTTKPCVLDDAYQTPCGAAPRRAPVTTVAPPSTTPTTEAPTPDTQPPASGPELSSPTSVARVAPPTNRAISSTLPVTGTSAEFLGAEVKAVLGLFAMGVTLVIVTVRRRVRL